MFWPKLLVLARKLGYFEKFSDDLAKLQNFQFWPDLYEYPMDTVFSSNKIPL